MCFYIHPKHKEPKKAKKNIVCWKFFDVNSRGSLYSPHQGTRYVEGVKYVSKIGAIMPLYWGGGAIYRGRHSYSIKRLAVAHVCSGKVYKKCIIPKGSTYYYNPNDKEYVSNQIIVLK